MGLSGWGMGLGVSDRAPHALSPQCWEVRKRNSSEWCRFVRSNPDCRLEGGFLDYLQGVFCVFPPQLLPLAVTLYVRMGAGAMLLGDAPLLGCGDPTDPPISAIPDPTGSLAPVPLHHPRRDGGEVVSSPAGGGDPRDPGGTPSPLLHLLLYPSSFCPNLSAISTNLKLSHNVAVSLADHGRDARMERAAVTGTFFVSPRYPARGNRFGERAGDGGGASGGVSAPGRGPAVVGAGMYPVSPWGRGHRVFSLTSPLHGVTFLAFGNGAPDVFSAVVAFSNPRTAGLAIGAVFGKEKPAGACLGLGVMGGGGRMFWDRGMFPLPERDLLRRQAPECS